MKKLNPAMWLTAATFALTLGGIATYGELRHQNDYPEHTVAVVPAATKDTLTVTYQKGEWLFSDDRSGDFTAINSSLCEAEDDCTVDYRDGAWFLETHVH